MNLAFKKIIIQINEACFTESPHVCVCIIALNLISLSQNGASTSPMTNVTSDTRRHHRQAELRLRVAGAELWVVVGGLLWVVTKVGEGV